MDIGRCLVRGILAGMAISIGGCVYLGCEVKWVGAILFSIGLFTVFTFGLDLYTGKVGYLVDNDLSYIPYLVLVIIGNFVGCLAVGLAMSSDAAVALAQTKLADPDYLRILFKGVFCGVLMFIAADYYKTKKSYLATVFCVPVFILAGFEHSIADMFYFCAGNQFTLEALIFILVVILGNAIGGMIIPAARKYMHEPADPVSRWHRSCGATSSAIRSSWQDCCRYRC